MYRSLNPEKIVATAEDLRERIAQRFPRSGLSRVAAELVSACEEAATSSRWLARPRPLVRSAGALGILLILAAGTEAFISVRVRMGFSTFTDLFQGIQAAIQTFVFLGIATVFLLTVETRVKRRRALSSLHVLRSLSHIIDMHQLPKDPERLAPAASPGQTVLTTSDLLRYLDFCSDLLAIISNVAALYVQNFEDPVTLTAVNEVEVLTAGLSRKIWQKIMILDRVASR
jgi:hypothetical protein